MAKKVEVDEQYQTGYGYELSEPVGQNFRDDFKPELTPQQMLQLGVFGGDYFKEVPSEFPADWFEGVELSSGRGGRKERNYYRVMASQPLSEWQRKGWIYEEDPLGWFLWYCRYYMGRRIDYEDDRQINRWKNMTRHLSQVKKYCQPGDQLCRRRQRQALLHWAYDPRKV